MVALPSNPRNAVIHDAEFTRKNYNTVALSSNPRNSFIHDAEIMKKNYYVVTLPSNSKHRFEYHNQLRGRERMKYDWTIISNPDTHCSRERA